MIELLAITAHPAPELAEVDELREVVAGDLAGLCTPAPPDTEATPDLLWRREELLEDLMAQRDLLPVRFGTVLRDEAAVAGVLTERSAELGAALERVRGAVEISVRAAGSSSPGPAHAALSALARASVRRPVEGGAETLRAAYLVDRDRVDSFVGAVARIDAQDDGLELLCTGPWPPWSFTA